MKLIFALALSSLCYAAEPAITPRPVPTAWKLSVAALVSANALDAISAPRDGIEGVPWLRNSEGGYSLGKGLAFKAAVFGPIILGEWLVIRHHPERAKAFSWLNLGGAAAFEGIAIQNGLR